MQWQQHGDFIFLDVATKSTFSNKQFEFFAVFGPCLVAYLQAIYLDYREMLANSGEILETPAKTFWTNTKIRRKWGIEGKVANNIKPELACCSDGRWRPW